MCIKVIERYAVCKCLVYSHAVDACASYERLKHSVRTREVLVGYACQVHSKTGSFVPVDEPVHTDKNLNFTKDNVDGSSIRVNSPARLWTAPRSPAIPSSARAPEQQSVFSQSKQDGQGIDDRAQGMPHTAIGENLSSTHTRRYAVKGYGGGYASPEHATIDRPERRQQLNTREYNNQRVPEKPDNGATYEVYLWGTNIGVISWSKPYKALGMMHYSYSVEKPLVKGRKRVRWKCVGSSYHCILDPDFLFADPLIALWP